MDQVGDWQATLMGKAAKCREKADQYGEAASLLRRIIFLLSILGTLGILTRLPAGAAITPVLVSGMAGVLGSSSAGFSTTDRYETAYRQYQTAVDKDGRQAALTLARYCGDAHLERQQSALAKTAADLLLAGDYSAAAKAQMELSFITEARTAFTGQPMKSVLNYSSDEGETDDHGVALVIDEPEPEPAAVTVASVIVKPLHRKDRGGVTLEDGKLVPPSDISSDAEEFGKADPPKKKGGLTKNQKRRLREQKHRKEPLPNSTAPLLAPPYYFSGREIGDRRRRTTPEAAVKRQRSHSRSPLRRPRTPDGCYTCASTLRLLEQASLRHAEMTELISRAVDGLKAETASTRPAPMSLPQKQRLGERLSRR
jgi:hypothetical protein